MNIGKTIRILRESKGMSTAELSRAAGIGPSFMSLVQNGRRSASIKVLGRIADALGLTTDALIFMSVRHPEWDHGCGPPHMRDRQADYGRQLQGGRMNTDPKPDYGTEVDALDDVFVNDKRGGWPKGEFVTMELFDGLKVEFEFIKGEGAYRLANPAKFLSDAWNAMCYELGRNAFERIADAAYRRDHSGGTR